MKKFIVMFVVLLSMAGFIVNKSFAEEAVNVGNKFCPLTGEEIGTEGMEGQEATVEYKGKTYNICCAMCKKDFLKNPEAAIKRMQDKEPALMK